MYAQLCKRLAEHAPNFESPDVKITTFKRLLLNKCRDEFENRTAVSATFDKRVGALSVDEEEAKFIAKRKMLGNIKFIGELGKLEMLHDSILHRCCEQLLVGRKKHPIAEQGEDLECLAYLFKTCGRILDSPKAKLLVDQYLERIRLIIANGETPTRIKFLLQDVIDLRENKWLPRKLATPDGPRTIQQVREDAARDGCIYLPQQDTPVIKNPAPPSKLQEVLFSKSRNKGMEDIFGGPGLQGPPSLGTGPGVIGGESEGYGGYDSYRNGGGHYDFNGRDHDGRDFKPKHRDNFENKYAERADFGDRFTANRNKTHPSNRGVGARGRMDSLGGRSNGYDRNGTGYGQHSNGDRDLPPRFKKMGGFGSGDRDNIQLRPSPNAMMLKPKTPSSLPKSATARLEGSMMPSSSNKMMMTAAEPAVFISKQSADKKRQEKKNQGPTREEVFGKIADVLKKLLDTRSTNEAFTVWKEGEIPSKMVNNALIHLFKQIVKIPEDSERDLCFELVEQLYSEDAVSQTHCKEGVSRLVQSLSNLETAEGGMVHLSVWALNTEKVKLADLAEMTEGGSTFPLFFSVLQKLANTSEDTTMAAFKESCIKLLDQLPTDTRSEDELGKVLEERKLAFLVPLLTIKSELWRQLETAPAPDQILRWIQSNVPEKHQEDPAFVYALTSNILRYITEQTEADAKDPTEKEKELIGRYKMVLKTFLKTSGPLQLVAIYALQVFCYSKQFPKGLLLRWFVGLYEADIIDENAFLSWKEDVNDSYPGKGKALFQVNQWLTWLEEAESEEEEDED